MTCGIAEPVHIDRIEVRLARDEHDPCVGHRPQKRPNPLEHQLLLSANEWEAHQTGGTPGGQARRRTVEIKEVPAVPAFPRLEAAVACQSDGVASVGRDPPNVRDRSRACRAEIDPPSVRRPPRNAVNGGFSGKPNQAPAIFPDNVDVAVAIERRLERYL